MVFIIGTYVRLLGICNTYSNLPGLPWLEPSRLTDQHTKTSCCWLWNMILKLQTIFKTRIEMSNRVGYDFSMIMRRSTIVYLLISSCLYLLLPFWIIGIKGLKSEIHISDNKNW